MRMDKPNLKIELMTSDAIRAAVEDDGFAQALYAAMCNVDWRKDGHAGEPSGTGWRQAGEIVADLRRRGESYLAFYCWWADDRDQVVEGVVRPDVAEALARLGWHPQPMSRSTAP